MPKAKKVNEAEMLEEKVEGFLAASSIFYDALEKLGKEYEHKPEAKVLIANAGAYMTKALRAIDLIKKLP